MKSFLFTIILSAATFFCKSQSVGIGTETPASSAQLEISSSTKGILFPRMTTVARLAINNPAKGLLVYDSTMKQMQYYDGSIWRGIFPDNTGWVTGAPIADFPGNTPFVPILTENERRIVFIGSPPIRAINDPTSGWKGGGLTIKDFDYGFGFYDFLTFDGKGIEARGLGLGEFLSRTLTLNKFAGNVAIGNNSATHARLEITGNVGASVAMFGSDKCGVTISADNPEIGFNYYYNGGTKTIKAGYASYIGMSPENGNIYIGNFNGATSTSNFGNINGASVKMYILQNGNVGIGTTNPTYKLSVNGNIRSKEVVVESGWADYVFAKGYSLPPLSQVEAFIKANGHLPNIPSATEIEQNGLSLGETQKKMMEKIEELTLYVIELEKKIEKLSNHR